MSEKIQFEVNEKGLWTGQLETLEIDIPNKLYKINGIPFEGRCSGLFIYFEKGEWAVRIDKGVEFKEVRK